MVMIMNYTKTDLLNRKLFSVLNQFRDMFQLVHLCGKNSDFFLLLLSWVYGINA